jgi:CBS domain containing-hemolysin-like protein
LKHDGIDTISGLIFHQLGYIPKAGTKVEIDALQLQIRQSSRKRVLEVLIRKVEPEKPQTAL